MTKGQTTSKLPVCPNDLKGPTQTHNWIPHSLKIDTVQPSSLFDQGLS